jgi:hypothetical protein
MTRHVSAPAFILIITQLNVLVTVFILASTYGSDFENWGVRVYDSMSYSLSHVPHIMKEKQNMKSNARVHV